ncbi:MAG TPA: permease-like cell division protein FtsX [Acidimicrobiia bacterium]|nr:permease-like cell division protein FtsX [Acidimicrobiia bacterium]
MSRLSYFARETLISLRRNLLMTAAGIMTVAVSLCLFGGVLLLSRMVDHGTARWKDGVELEIFMDVDATGSQVTAISEELAAERDLVESFRYLSKNDAYEEFRRIFQDQPDLVENVDPESLPESFRVVPAEAELTETIANRFSGRGGVDEVVTAQEQVDRMLTVTRWIRVVFFVAAGVLLAASLFLIVNTIRLATYARRREIEVMKLVGASNTFVRIPFMAEGLVQGAIGAGIAFGVVYILKQVLSDLVEGVDNLFRDFYLTNGDAIGIGLLILVIGAAIGAIGSLIGLRKFLEV